MVTLACVPGLVCKFALVNGYVSGAWVQSVVILILREISLQSIEIASIGSRRQTEMMDWVSR